jgi:hypothetical protein
LSKLTELYGCLTHFDLVLISRTQPVVCTTTSFVVQSPRFNLVLR